MSVFDHYARFYDLLYRDKDYAAEAEFVHKRLQEFKPGAQTLLELGCGTGRHAVELARRGYQVTGVDRSDDMLAQAQARLSSLPHEIAGRLAFRQGDITTVRTGEFCDAVISLFHVISYQTTNEALEAAFATAAAHLKPGRVFLFDFWYGPAVLSDPPQVRIKRLQDEETEVTRLAEPEVDVNANRVTVNYHVFIKDKETGQYSEIRESHPMRYLFLPELCLLLANKNLRVLASGSWLENSPLGSNTWYGWLVAVKL